MAVRVDLCSDVIEPSFKKLCQRSLFRRRIAAALHLGDNAGKVLLRLTLAGSALQTDEANLAAARLLRTQHRIPLALPAFSNMSAHYFLPLDLSLNSRFTFTTHDWNSSILKPSSLTVREIESGRSSGKDALSRQIASALRVRPV